MAPSRGIGATCGLIAAAVALAVGELVAGMASSLRSPIVAVGDSVIDNVPRAVKDWAIDTFQTADKVALVVGILVVAALCGALLGVASRRNPVTGVVGLGAFAVVGIAAGAPAPSVFAWVAGSTALWWLISASEPPAQDASPARAAEDRRRFVLGATSLVAVAAIAASSGRWLQQRVSAVASRMAVVLPRATRPSPEPPPEVQLDVEGLGLWRTPLDDFYRIDVNLVVPQVPAETWSLRVHGMVDRELVLSFDDLISRELVEEDVTLCCVSNEVGGDLVGNARWLGARLDSLLAEAGVSPDADQIVGRSSDGFTAGFPVSALDGRRPALVAVGMNGEPLPIEHGFPARLVVAGLYGYVSATKWLTEIELTRFDLLDTYWTVRGWSVDGPVKVASRIDVPRPGGKVPAGAVAVAGVAWAQPVGVARVEVRIDDGDWIEARLGAEANTSTWRQWSVVWDAEPGSHVLEVRATDHDGAVQTEQRADPFPDGASGWHRIGVEVAPSGGR